MDKLNNILFKIYSNENIWNLSGGVDEGVFDLI